PGVEGVFDVALEGVGLDLPECGELVDADQVVGTALDRLGGLLAGSGRGERVQVGEGEDFLPVDPLVEGFGPAVGAPTGGRGVHRDRVGGQPQVLGSSGAVGGLAATDDPGLHGLPGAGVATA